ncbi:MAG: DUF1080 domain-containing protein, partial [Tannerella sp.]|nr:DUF1080 domain-containing protein [Tannerella sp.]
MKRMILFASVIGLMTFASCSGGKKYSTAGIEYTVTTKEVVVPADTVNGTPEYTILEKSQVDISKFPVDKDGYTILFAGDAFSGWRGYNKDVVPSRWIIEDEAIKFVGSGAGEAQKADGGDLLFAYKFKNFELSYDWKVAKGSNSGVLYLGLEIKDQPNYISAPESQVLDNERHP